MARIIWTESEQDSLFTATMDQMKKSPKLFIVKAINTAQLVLPASRRRKIAVIDNVPDYLRKRLIINGLVPENWQGLRQRKGRGKTKLTPEQAAQLQESLESSRDRIKVLEDENGHLKAELNAYKYAPKPKSEMEIIKEFLAGILGDALAKANVRAPGGSTQEPVGDSPPPAPRPKHDAEPRPIEKNGRKPRVVVIGTKPEQAGILQSEFQKELDIRFYIADAPTGQLQIAAENADRVLVWIDFVNHRVTECLSKDNLVRVNGGMTSLRNALATIVREAAH